MTKIRLEDISKEEWEQYDWIEVEPGIFLRSIKKIEPPDDGYVYVDATRLGDREQRWKRAQEYVVND